MSESRDDSLEQKKDAGLKGPGSSEPAPETPEQDLSWLIIPPASEPVVKPEDRDSVEGADLTEIPARDLPWEPSQDREPQRKPPEPRRESPPNETRRAAPHVTPRQSNSSTGSRPGEAAQTKPPRQERQAQASSAGEHRDYQAVVQEIQQHLAHGYSLLGLVGYSGSGKTHFLRALSLLLREQGFEVEAWETLRKALVPDYTEQSVFDYPCTGPQGEKWVFVDAAGEFYARLRENDWGLREESTALLHFLHYCRGLFLVLHLQPAHFRAGSLGAHRSMSPQDRAADLEAQQAQEELDFFDRVLLFLRALKKEGGKVEELVKRCAEAPTLDKALRSYRDAPKLEFPVMVLFSQADSFDDSSLELATGSFLSPRKDTVNVAAFAARYLPGLYGSLVRHARRFKFDFVQSYEVPLLPGQLDEKGNPAPLPKWDIDGELLSVGALSALEFLQRNLPADPAKGCLQRFLQRCELKTRPTLFLNRLLHPKQWWGVKVRS